MEDFKERVKNFMDEVTEDSLAQQFIYADVSYDSEEYEERQLADKYSLRFEFVVDYGGEGMGDDFWCIYKLIDTNNEANSVLIKFQGWYASSEGAEFTDWFAVEAFRKTVTDYRAIKL